MDFNVILFHFTYMIISILLSCAVNVSAFLVIGERQRQRERERGRDRDRDRENQRQRDRERERGSKEKTQKEREVVHKTSFILL